jgi:hypothetical protein
MRLDSEEFSNMNKDLLRKSVDGVATLVALADFYLKNR